MRKMKWFVMICLYGWRHMNSLLQEKYFFKKKEEEINAAQKIKDEALIRKIWIMLSKRANEKEWWWTAEQWQRNRNTCIETAHSSNGISFFFILFFHPRGNGKWTLSTYSNFPLVHWKPNIRGNNSI